MTAPLSAEEFRRITGVSRETCEKLGEFLRHLAAWQAKINLVSSASLADVWRRHVLDSAQLYPHLPRPCDRLLDLGSGAGFPGLVLAVIGLRGVHLVDSDGRKCAFLNHVARKLDVPVTVHRRRIEEMPPVPAGCVTARACAPLPRLLRLAAPFCNGKTRCLFLKGAGVDNEIAGIGRHYSIERIPSLSSDSGTVLRIDGSIDAAII